LGKVFEREGVVTRARALAILTGDTPGGGPPNFDPAPAAEREAIRSLVASGSGDFEAIALIGASAINSPHDETRGAALAGLRRLRTEVGAFAAFVATFDVDFGARDRALSELVNIDPQLGWQRCCQVLETPREHLHVVQTALGLLADLDSVRTRRYARKLADHASGELAELASSALSQLVDTPRAAPPFQITKLPVELFDGTDALTSADVFVRTTAMSAIAKRKPSFVGVTALTAAALGHSPSDRLCAFERLLLMAAKEHKLAELANTLAHTLSSYAMSRVARHFANGRVKYRPERRDGERVPIENWRRGMDTARTMESLLRHAFAYLEGQRDEDHLAAVVFNALVIIETEEMVRRELLPPTLLTLPDWTRPNGNRE
jgi:hypothetical protein